MADFDSIAAAVHDEMERTGEECAAYVRESLNVPYPPSSEPGEKPHKRTGNLQAGVSDLTQQSGDFIITEVVSEVHYGAYLEPSRPFMQPASDKWSDEMADRLRALVGAP